MTEERLSGWEAELQLRFGPRQGRTVLSERRHRGPLLMQRLFYPEGATAHGYILHPPGGVVGGDRLRIQAQCEAGAAALLTTPAAGKFYRSGGPVAHQAIDLQVADGASLEWLPQETLLFDGARVDSTLRIALQPLARFIGWDILCVGRPASGEAFTQGLGRFRLQLWREETPLLLENFRVDAQFCRARWGLRGNPALAALYATPFPEQGLAELRALLEPLENVGCTLLGDLLVCRGMAPQVERLRRVLEALWRIVRPLVLHREAVPPRIWAT